MITYLLKRVLFTLPVLFGVTVVVFFVVALIPGDAVAAMMTQVKLEPAQMANLRRQLGLDDALHVQLGRYLADLARGDLGNSVFGYRPVATISAHYIPNPSFRSAIADFVAREARMVEADIEALDMATPFRRGSPPMPQA